MLFSIGWALAISTLFAYLGFSIEIGALLAGVALSLSPYKYEISSKMKPLRDFFLLLFFIVLGSQMTFTSIRQYIYPIMAFSIFVLIGKMLILIILMGSLNYTKRNSFLTGLTLSQISEFSLIIIALGVSVGHLTDEILSLVTIVGLITIGFSAYSINYANRIYNSLLPYLNIFQRKHKKST